MARVSERNLSPRNGHTLMAGLGARISGCAKQREMSLEDQTDHNREVVTDLYDGSVEYLIIATKGKGESLDRPELAEIEAEFRKRQLDLFVWEDLGRLVRGVRSGPPAGNRRRSRHARDRAERQHRHGER